MRWFVACVAALAGCYSPSPLQPCQVSCAASGVCPSGLECVASDGLCHAPGESCTVNDAPLPPDDTPGDATGELCLGHGIVTLCVPSDTSGTYTASESIDTDDVAEDCTREVVLADGPPLCAIIAKKIVITGTLNVTGRRPLLLVATDRIEITGTINTLGEIQPTECGVLSNGKDNDNGGGGGAGGTFRTRGGNGGKDQLLAGAASSGLMVPLPSHMRFGCRGGNGGRGIDPGLGGNGGYGGGAIAMLALNLIDLDGTINANGTGGKSGTGLSGGGGGGSGGMILLDATTIKLKSSSNVFAVGGGGGAGARPDGSGEEGETTEQRSDVPAEGGQSYDPGVAGDGGNGAGNSNPGIGRDAYGDPQTSNSSGAGGGGGGTGFIVVEGTLDSMGMFVPAPL